METGGGKTPLDKVGRECCSYFTNYGQLYDTSYTTIRARILRINHSTLLGAVV